MALKAPNKPQRPDLEYAPLLDQGLRLPEEFDDWLNELTELYALRNLVERCINKLKNTRRVGTRYDKTAAS